jgi:hypothetical protein
MAVDCTWDDQLVARLGAGEPDCRARTAVGFMMAQLLRNRDDG